MAYNDDVVLARLSSLNDTQDSIATTSQWLMFHRRHSERTVQLWLQRLKESSSTKRLNLIYLANDVTQRSKARQKDDFLVAFSPVIAEATAIAYKGAPADVRQKLKRVVDVWKERSVFEASVQAAIETKLGELDQIRSGPSSIFGAHSFLGGGAAVPAELARLTAAHQKASKLSGSAKPAVATAAQEYQKLTDPSNSIPSAPVFAARLNGLLKTLAVAEGAVAESVKVRREHVAALETLLLGSRQTLEMDEKDLERLSAQKAEIEEKKQEIELAIMRGLGSHDGTAHGNDETTGGGGGSEPDRPEVEALTPPSVASLGGDSRPSSPGPGLEPSSAAPSSGPVTFGTGSGGAATAGAASDTVAQYPAMGPSWSNKRRRVAVDDIFPGLEDDDGIDSEVTEILRKRDNPFI